MTDEVLVDALPYYDSGYDEPGVRQAALALVEEECRRYKPTKNYLEFLGQANLHSFETDVMKNEFERLEKRMPMDMLSMKRYELPPPPHGKINDVSAWNECVENSFAQLEHQASRIINLEIMADFGATSWRVYNQTLQSMFEEATKQLNNVKSQIQEVNLARKTEQTYAGEKLRSLEQEWVGLVSKNYEIECAIVELEKEVLHMKLMQQQQQSQDKENEDEENTEQQPAVDQQPAAEQQTAADQQPVTPTNVETVENSVETNNENTDEAN